MREENIFEKEIIIPDIVQKKADLAYAQIAAEDNSDDSKTDIEVKRNNKKSGYKLATRAAALVASVAVVFVAISIATNRGRTDEATNIFSITVFAQEMDENKKASIKDFDADLKIIDIEEEYCMSACVIYKMKMPIKIQGDKIKDISYHIDGGIFLLQSEDGEYEKLVDAEPASSINEYTTESYDMDHEEFFEGFTVSYDNQSSYELSVVCNSGESDILYYLNYNNDERKYLLQQVYNKMLEQTCMTCTITFEDGTKDTRNLRFMVDENSTPICAEAGEAWELPYSKEELARKVEEEAKSYFQGETYSAPGDTLIVNLQKEGEYEFKTKIGICWYDRYISMIKKGQQDRMEVMAQLAEKKVGDVVEINGYKITILEIEKLYN